jgi:hypothetical protein
MKTYDTRLARRLMGEIKTKLDLEVIQYILTQIPDPPSTYYNVPTSTYRRIILGSVFGYLGYLGGDRGGMSIRYLAPLDLMWRIGHNNRLMFTIYIQSKFASLFSQTILEIKVTDFRIEAKWHKIQ